MYISNIRGAISLMRRKPQAASVAGGLLKRRLVETFTNGRVSNWNNPPEVVTAYVTDICNLRCKMCQYAYSDDPAYQLGRVGSMEFSVFRKLIDETAGSPIVSLTGGETLLNPKIADFIAYAKNNGRFCTMVTNGWMLAKRAEEICEAGLDNLVVSVDGPRETHTAVRGAKSFDRLVEGIKTILEQTNRPNVIVSTAISNINYNKLVQVYELAQSWGVDGMNFNHLWMQTSEIVEAYNSQSTIFPVSEVAWSIKPGDVDVAKLADEIETIRRRNWGKRLTFTETPYLKRDEIAVWYKKPEQFVKWDTATCAWNHLRVWPDGNVRPCRTWEVGNIAKQHAMEIWNGKEIRNLRQTLAENGALAICARCCLFAYR